MSHDEERKLRFFTLFGTGFAISTGQTEIASLPKVARNDDVTQIIGFIMTGNLVVLSSNSG
jgi:hypothetical protein